MNEIEQLMAELKAARDKIYNATSILGFLEKAREVDDFEAGYEQAWLEVTSILIGIAKDRFDRRLKNKVR